MRFGELLLQRSCKGFRYLNYALLKEIIYSQDFRNFDEALKSELTQVDLFFQQNTESQTYEFAAINYIATLKIIKKYKKVTNEQFTVRMYATQFGHALESGLLAIESLNECFCPICISDSVTSAQLPCSHSVCFDCLKRMSTYGIHACPICRSELVDSNCANDTVDTILGKHSSKYHPKGNTKTQVKVMSWNICALTFPLHTSWLQFAFFFILTGTFQVCKTFDVQLYFSDERIKQQAEFIKNSFADVILLQEVLDEKTLLSLSHLLPEYRPIYCVENVKLTNLILYGFCAFMISFIQYCFLQYAFECSHAFILVLMLWNMWRWRNSIIASFLCGRVQGQLAILSKHKNFHVKKSFVCFETANISSSWSMFLLSHIRRRGLLKYSYKGIEIVNIHMPHGLYQMSCYDTIRKCCKSKPLVLGGDFNPLPGVSDETLFMPLKSMFFNCESKHVTWNLEEPYTRKTYLTPTNMQLDYILHTNGISQTRVVQNKISDHYALCCDFTPDSDLIFEIE